MSLIQSRILNILNKINVKQLIPASFIHTTPPAEAGYTPNTGPRRFIENNKKTFPIQEDGEEPRPAVRIHNK